MKTIFAYALCTTVAAVAAADPVVDEVSVTPSATDNSVAVSYRLEGAPAIVTVDVKTNGVSIGGEHIRSLAPASAINGKIDADGTYSFTWDVGRDWDAAAIGTIPVDIVVTAWKPSDPPDVMVLDLMKDAPNPVRYYEDVAQLPGGLLENAQYRTTKMVFRLCRTRGKSLQRGTPEGKTGRNNNQYLFKVGFTNHYYMAAFEMTHGQWLTVSGGRRNDQFYTQDWELRPVLSVGLTLLREAPGTVSDDNTTAADLACMWPKKPHADSPLGIIRSRTGVWVDVPSESQWEIACRAGSDAYVYPNGAEITGAATDDNFPDRYKNNGGLIGSYTRYTMPEWMPAASGGTSKVGSGMPNAWGLYDMYGNVAELCMDCWKYDPQADAQALKGDPVYDAAAKNFLVRGSSWIGDAGLAPSVRNSCGAKGNNNSVGVRLMVREGL